MGVAEFISRDKFATESRINVLIPHARTLWSSPKMMSYAQNDLVFTGKRVRKIQIMTSDFKPEVVIWSRLHSTHMHWKITKIHEKRRRAAKMSTS